MAEPASVPSAVVVTKVYDLTLWVLPKVERFPRSYRFSVGDRIVTTVLDLLTCLVEAAYSQEKSALLRTASQKANALRYLLRLAKDLKLLNKDGYEFVSERLEEVGRMVGGWQRSLQQTRG